MAVRPKPGYAHEWIGKEKICPRTQDWDIVVIGERECDIAEIRGIRAIDGDKCAIFFIEEVNGDQRYIAQLECFCQC